MQFAIHKSTTLLREFTIDLLSALGETGNLTLGRSIRSKHECVEGSYAPRRTFRRCATAAAGTPRMLPVTFVAPSSRRRSAASSKKPGCGRFSRTNVVLTAAAPRISSPSAPAAVAWRIGPTARWGPETLVCRNRTSGSPSGVRGAGAVRFGLPSPVRGIPAVPKFRRSEL